VWECGLKRASDATIWNYPREHGYTVVSQDADFSGRGELLGFPPKVVWMRRGNCSTAEIESILRRHHGAVTDIEKDTEAGVLTIL